MANNIELELLPTKCLSDIILSSKAHITKSFEQCELKIKNYAHVACSSVSRHIWRVVVYIKNGIKHTVKNLSKEELVLSSLKLKFVCEKKNVPLA